MNRYVLAASTLSTAVGLALAIQASPGQATKARDTKSFVMLPAGDCSKIQGGKTTAS